MMQQQRGQDAEIVGTRTQTCLTTFFYTLKSLLEQLGDPHELRGKGLID